MLYLPLLWSASISLAVFLDVFFAEIEANKLRGTIFQLLWQLVCTQFIHCFDSLGVVLHKRNVIRFRKMLQSSVKCIPVVKFCT